MKLTNGEKNRIVDAFNAKRWKGYKVEIYSMSMFEENAKYGVNWAALGTVTIAQANKFIRQLNEAIKIADKLNRS